MYRAGAHVIELAVDDPAAVAFLDSFLERANPTEAGERRCLATISVADEPLFSGAGDSLVMSPLPTLAKVRADVAHRFMPFLLARADDTFNAAQLDQWRRSGHKHWTDTPLYLTFGALGQRFSSIPVSERRVHLVGVRFADPEAPVSLTRLEGRDALDVLLANRKELVPSFADVMDFAAEQAGAESRLVREIASRLHVVRFRHEGEVKPALYSGSPPASLT